MNLQYLKARSRLLQRLRLFFLERGFLEVETPLAASEIIPELHIDPPKLDGKSKWLQASPEMHLKRLLCAGSGAVFEITRSFRSGERGTLHAPEFTIVEWYRPGDDMQAGMQLLAELVCELTGVEKTTSISYREAFLAHAEIDPHEASTAELQQAAAAVEQQLAGETDCDELLNFLLAKQVEPQLGVAGPQVLYHYPASQSALATTTTDQHGTEVAERFELYWQGVELANGYRELTDAAELRQRLTRVSQQRKQRGRSALPLPEKLLGDMAEHGLPACAGVALGFDRLVMLILEAESIEDVRTF